MKLCCGTQVVAGRNDVFLCTKKYVVEKAVEVLASVVISAPLSENPRITEVTEIVPLPAGATGQTIWFLANRC